MKKLLIAPILLVIAIAVSAATIEVPEAPAFMLIAGGGVEDEEPIGGTVFDDFSGDLSKWDDKSGSWFINVSEELILSSGTNGVITYTDATVPTDGYLRVQITGITNYLGVHFRGTNSGSGYMYAVRFYSNTVAWRYCTDSTATCTDIATDSMTFPSDNDYIQVEWSGSGTSTQVKVWNLGSTPAARGSEGTADVTFDDDPSEVANDGTYVGCYHGSTGGGDWDNFSAGGLD